jgi:DNA-3-methyladenine glycosylase I
MEAPKQIKPKDPADYLEVMTKAVFQSGISWRVIESKWDGFREAFFGFDAEKVSDLDPPDVDRLAQDTRIVRNRRKIEATVENARILLDLDHQFGSFKKYLRSHDGFEETMADLKKRFKFMGDTGAYYFLYVVGEEVPPHEDWMARHGSGLRGQAARGSPRARG